MRSYSDTTAYEQAFEKLDLLVSIEVALSETARLSDYVLPARSAYEKWDCTYFAWNFPDTYFQIRRPVVEPEGEPLEESEIHIRLADRLGLLPDVPDSLYEAARGNRMQFGQTLMAYAQQEPLAMKFLPFVVGKTLGAALGSPNLAVLWGMLQTVPSSFRTDAARDGFDPGLALGEQIFKALLDHPEGTWVAKCDAEDNFTHMRTPEGRINLLIPELAATVSSIDVVSEAEALRMDPQFPLILMAGRHFDENANTIMGDPAWNKGRDHCCSLAMHPIDADALGLRDGQMVQVTTEAGREEIELEITDEARPGHVAIPHGFGLVHEGRVFGANVNRLTRNTHRDPIAATPLHRFVPCRVEPVSRS